MSQITLEGDVAGVLSLEKQIKFAAASALTATGSEARDESVREIEGAFVNRSDWYLPSRPSGVRSTRATPDDLEAEVTGPGFLAKHERGGTHGPERARAHAVPTRELRPDPRQSIPQSMRPRNLSGAFVLKTKRGPVLFRREGKEVRALYGLERSVRVERRSVIIEPTRRVVEERFAEIFGVKLKPSLDAAR